MWLLLVTLCNAIDLHFIPHTHIDVGWTKTIETYYTTKVSKALTNIITLLEENTSRTFVWSETFWLKTYLDNVPEMKPKLLRLIHDGRLEIVGGGWVMHDESLLDIELVSRQLETGHAYLRDELGIDHVSTAWQLDPFGHSSLTPGLFEKFGYDNLVMGRVEGKFHERLKESGNLEFVWKSSRLGAQSGIFTHLLYNHYSLPQFLDSRDSQKCFRSLPLSETDLNRCLSSLKSFVTSMSKGYDNDVIMILFGDDEFFHDLNESRKLFKFLEDLKDSSHDINIKLSTPSQYFEAAKAKKQTFPVVEGDLLPYITTHIRRRPLSWTGYYSSRPSLKKQIYENHNLARATEIFAALTNHSNILASASCANTHHDAITGTNQYKVYLDYTNRLNNEQSYFVSVISQLYTRMLIPHNESYALITPYKILVAFNSLNWKVTQLLSYISTSPYVLVYDSSGVNLPSQSIPLGDSYIIFFKVTLQALSFTSIFINQQSSPCNLCSELSETISADSISNGLYEITFDNGLIENISAKGARIFLSSSLIRYGASEGGAYEFRPMKEGVKTGSLKSFTIYKGSLLTYVISEFYFKSQVYMQKVIIPEGSDYFIMKFKLKAELGDEVFMRMYNPTSENRWFYSFNTADVVSRRKSKATSSLYGENEFPIVGALLIKSDEMFLHIYPRFPLGAGMVGSNFFELHLHRNPERDDVLGLGLPLNDTTEVEHEFLFTIDTLNFTNLWKNYLTHKNRPQIFAVNSSDQLTLSISKAKLHTNPYSYKTEYSIGSEDQCTYLSRLHFAKETMVADLLNICDKADSFELKNSQIIKPVLTNGNQIRVRNEYSIDETIKYIENEQMLEKWPSGDKTAHDLKPFEFQSFEILHNLSEFYTNNEKNPSIYRFSNIIIKSEFIDSSSYATLLMLVIILFTLSLICVLAFSLLKLKNSKKLE